MIACALTAPAAADTVAALDHDHHDHAHHESVEPAAPHVHDTYGAVLGGHHHGGGAVSVSAGAFAASYDTRLFTGDYQGVVAGAAWNTRRVSVAAALAAYRIDRNGLAETGIGDVMLHAHATVLERRRWSTGVMMMASAPTGSSRIGLGMGHAMLMPEAWTRARFGRTAVTAFAGYGHALGGADAHAEHGGGGAWPLVAPMNAREVGYGVEAMTAVSSRVGLGVLGRGAVPVGDGATRLFGGVRVVGMLGTTRTALDLQQGLVGDPFGTRVVLETTFHFD